jgi:hypothetical protein
VSRRPPSTNCEVSTVSRRKRNTSKAFTPVAMTQSAASLFGLRATASFRLLSSTTGNTFQRLNSLKLLLLSE